MEADEEQIFISRRLGLPDKGQGSFVFTQADQPTPQILDLDRAGKPSHRPFHRVFLPFDAFDQLLLASLQEITGGNQRVIAQGFDRPCHFMLKEGRPGS